MSQKHSKINILHDLLSVTYGYKNKIYLSNRATDNLSFTQRLKLVNQLDVHNGCVNTICWNSSGQLILSGSDDQHLVVVNPFTGKVEVAFRTAHRANIFSARFLPNCQDRQTISCSADGLIYYCDFDRPDLLSTNGFDCHMGAVYEVLIVPNDSYTFLSCGEDGTVRWFDLRTKTRCHKANCEDDVMINTQQAVMSLAINPMMPYQLAVGCADSSVRVYDRRQLATGSSGADHSRSRAMLHNFSAPSLGKRNHRITSLAYSRDGEELLVSYSSEHLYLFNFKDREGENEVPLIKSFKDLENVNGLFVDSPENVVSTSAGCSSSSDATQPSENVFRPCTGQQPPLKRLRLRGDWSDTGPNARPERERDRDRTPQDENASSIMQRMSNMLTRLLEGRMRQDHGSDRPSDQVESGQASEEGSRPGTDDSVRMDGDLPTTESNLSSSDASSTAFVSFSVSDKDESVEDSKESFEMSENTFSSSCSKGAEEYSNLALDSNPLLKTADQESADVVKKRDKLESVTEESKFVMVSDNQLHPETMDLENKSPSLYAKDSCNGLDVGKSNSQDKALVTCSGHASQTVTVSTTAPDSVTELNVDDSVRRLPSVDLSSACVIRKSRDEAVASPVLGIGFVRNDQDESTTELDRVAAASEFGGSVKVCDASDLSQVSNFSQNSDSGGGGMRYGEKVSTLADSLADVLVTEHVSTMDDPHEKSESKEKTESQEEHVSSSLASNVCKLQVSVTDSSPKLCASSVDKHKSKEAVEADSFVSCTADLKRQASDGREEKQGTSVASSSDNAEASDSDHADEDSDSDESYASPASRQAWLEQKQSLEKRNAAASKLQAVFRQRLEQRSRETDLPLPKPVTKQCFVGHRNSRTMIKEAAFWGDHYVMSGSDCGHIFIWDRHSAKLVMLLEGDRHVVNCLQPHPFDPILASSGIDYDIKIWMPVIESPSFDYARASELMRRNEIMLEETRDTVTVPASFMLRMLLSLNHARRGRAGGSGGDRFSSHGSSASSRDE